MRKAVINSLLGRRRRENIVDDIISLFSQFGCYPIFPREMSRLYFPDMHTHTHTYRYSYEEKVERLYSKHFPTCYIKTLHDELSISICTRFFLLLLRSTSGNNVRKKIKDLFYFIETPRPPTLLHRCRAQWRLTMTPVNLYFLEMGPGRQIFRRIMSGA
jgi:hypothetical protein